MTGNIPFSFLLMRFAMLSCESLSGGCATRSFIRTGIKNFSGRELSINNRTEVVRPAVAGSQPPERTDLRGPVAGREFRSQKTPSE